MEIGRRLAVVVVALGLSVGAVFAASAASTRALDASSARAAQPLSAADSAAAAKLLDETPLLFERNEGQYGNGFDFVSRTPGRTFLVHPWGAAVNLRNATNPELTADVALRFEGSRASARPLAMPASGGIINYYMGHDRSQWRTGITSYPRLRYAGVYEGIDVEYYGQGDQLEYDLIVAPGADPAQIGLRFEGARTVCIDADGALVVDTAAGELRQILPSVYQRDARGGKTTVHAAFSLDRGKVRIELGEYDRSRELIIDPSVIWSHQFLTKDLTVKAIAVDPAGNIFLAGQMYNSVTTGAGYDIQPVGGSIPQIARPGYTASAFVIGFTPSKSVIFSTYLGAGNVTQMVLANVSGGPQLYVCGSAGDDFPTTVGAYQELSTGAGPFVMNLNTSGTVVWSTYLTGEKTNDAIADIAADSSGAVYAAGLTTSETFPFTRIEGTGTGTIGFVTKIAPGGASLSYSSLIDVNPVAIALDDTNAAYVASSGGVTKLDASGHVVLTGTIDTGGGIKDVAVDTAHDIYLVGGVTLPGVLAVTPDAVSGSCGALGCGFYVRLDPTASVIKYATYLGARNVTADPVTYATTVIVDSSNRAIIAALGANLPTAVSLPYTADQLNRILRFTTGNGLEYSTNVSGTIVPSLVTDAGGNVFVSDKRGQASGVGPLASILKNYIRVREISFTATQPLGLFDIEPSAFVASAPGTIKAYAEHGYFQSGATLSIGTGSAAFGSFEGDPVTPTTSVWNAPVLASGVKSATISSGGSSFILDNAIEYLAEPLSITSITPSTINSTDAATTVFTITGTGFGPESIFDMTGSVPGFDLGRRLETYRVDQHTVKMVIPQLYFGTPWPHTFGIAVSNPGNPVTLTNGLTVNGTSISLFSGVGPTTGGTSIPYKLFKYETPPTVNSISIDGLSMTPVFVSSGFDFDNYSITTPAHTATGRYDALINSSAGTEVVPKAFRYYQAVTVTNLSATTGGSAGGTAVTITGTGFLPGARVFFGNVVATATYVSATQINATSPPHNPGAVKVDVRNLDGGWASGPTFTYSGPAITGASPSAGPSEGGTSVIVSVTGHDGTAKVYFGGVEAAVTARGGGSITATTPAHAAGYVDVAVTNAAGTGDSGTLIRGFRYTSVPVVSNFTPAGGGPGTSVVITGNKFTGASQVTFGGIAATSFTVNGDTQITAIVPAGALTGVIRVTAGLDSGVSAGTFYVTPRFSATPFNPTSALPGASITISGQNFQGVTAVTFSGGAASVFSSNGPGTLITVTVPASAVTGGVSVTAPGGSASSAASFGVPPAVSTFSPGSGPTGTTVTITGQRFSGATAVTFGGTAATSFTVVNATSITAVSPQNSSGPICVTTPGGNGCSGTSWVGAPRVTGFSPTSGLPGASVTISGLSFTGATQVQFNGVAATPFTVNSDTQITTTVPANATTGPISVTTANGTGTSSSNFGVLPYISTFTPTSGGSGTSVTISGYQFTGATAVTFGGVSASFTVNSDTTVTAIVPGTAVTGPIGITTPAGTATSSTSFTVGATISNVTPNKWTGGANPITITGNNFNGATSVTFGGTAGSCAVNSNTQITCTIPGNPNSGYVVVTTPLGTGTSTSLFYGITTFSSFSPSSGAQGDIITINGLNFTGTTSVGFGNPIVYTNIINVLSNTQMQVQVPGFAAVGSNAVTVTTGYGTPFQSGIFFTVTAAGPPVLQVRRVGGASGAIALQWSGALMQYDILRSTSSTTGFAAIASAVQSNIAVDGTTTPGQVYFYKIHRVGTSQDSNVDFGVSYVFTDDPIAAGSTAVKAAHLTQLRQAVNLMRVAANLGNYPWAEGSVGAGTTIKASHVNELRTAVTQAWGALGVGTVNFTEPGTLTNSFSIKAVHFQELRNVVK